YVIGLSTKIEFSTRNFKRLNPSEFEQPSFRLISKRSNSAFFLVDRPLRRAMLNPLGFADILNIEQGTARSTCARTGVFCFARIHFGGRAASRPIMIGTTQRSSLQRREASTNHVVALLTARLW